MPYNSRIPRELQLLRAGLENEEDTAIFAYTTTASVYYPSYFIGDAVEDPETMDIQGALEETLRSLIDNGCTLEAAKDIMGLSDVPVSDLGEDEYIDIDLGLSIEGSLISVGKLDPESSDIRELFSEQQIVNIAMAFDTLEPDVRMQAAGRFASDEFTGWQAQEVCKAYREHLPMEAIDAIADRRLKPDQMRALAAIARITEPSPDGTGEPPRPALHAILGHLDEVVPKLHLMESLAVTAHENGIPFDVRWCSLDTEQVVSLRTAVAVQAPPEALEAFSGGRYPAASMDCITIAYCGGNDRMDASPLLDPAYTPEQLWCLSSAVASHARGDISDAQLDFLCNPELSAELMNATRNCFTYYGLTIEQAEQRIVPGVTPEQVYRILDGDMTPARADGDHGGRGDAPSNLGTLREEAAASRKAAGRLEAEADAPTDHEDLGQEK